MFNRRLAAVGTAAVILLAACSSSGASSAPSAEAPSAAAPSAAAPSEAAPSAAACTVGVSWNNYQEERWAKCDEPAIKAAVEAGGGTYISNDAKSSAEQQATNVENLISQGANVAHHPRPGRHGHPAGGRRARSTQGIPVIAYDRLIEDPGALYITFDNVEVGRHAGRGRSSTQVPKGNYVDHQGQHGRRERRLPAAAAWRRSSRTRSTAGDIKIVGETYTDNWDPANAQTEMEQFLTAEQQRRRRRPRPRTTAWPAASSPRSTAQGLAGKVPVSGQDGDAAALNRVALGTQTVDVWKDARELGKAAGEAAVAAVRRTRTLDEGRRAPSPFTTPGRQRRDRRSCSTPIPITKDNLNVVVDARLDHAGRRSARASTAGAVGGLPVSESHDRSSSMRPALAVHRGAGRSLSGTSQMRRVDD